MEELGRDRVDGSEGPLEVSLAKLDAVAAAEAEDQTVLSLNPEPAELREEESSPRDVERERRA